MLNGSPSLTDPRLEREIVMNPAMKVTPTYVIISFHDTVSNDAHYELHVANISVTADMSRSCAKPFALKLYGSRTFSDTKTFYRVTF